MVIWVVVQHISCVWITCNRHRSISVDFMSLQYFHCLWQTLTLIKPVKFIIITQFKNKTMIKMSFTRTFDKYWMNVKCKLIGLVYCAIHISLSYTFWSITCFVPCYFELKLTCRQKANFPIDFHCKNCSLLATPCIYTVVKSEPCFQ